MARPVYPHEMVDPDFQWLLSTYRESHPNMILVEVSCLPVALVFCPEGASIFDAASPTQTPEQGFPANTDQASEDVAEDQEM